MTTPRDLTTPELRPCPFCGGEAGVFFNSDARVGFIDIQCKSCQNGTGYWRTEAAAVTRWNRRPRTFTAAEVAEVFAGLEAKWREPESPPLQMDAWRQSIRDGARIDCADELHERITHWLRENEG
jgi:Lar family restriction alleviation protein